MALRTLKKTNCIYLVPQQDCAPQGCPVPGGHNFLSLEDTTSGSEEFRGRGSHIHLRGGCFQEEPAARGGRAEDVTFPVPRCPCHAAALFPPKWVPRVTGGPAGASAKAAKGTSVLKPPLVARAPSRSVPDSCAAPSSQQERSAPPGRRHLRPPGRGRAICLSLWDPELAPRQSFRVLSPPQGRTQTRISNAISQSRTKTPGGKQLANTLHRAQGLQLVQSFCSGDADGRDPCT